MGFSAPLLVVRGDYITNLILIRLLYYLGPLDETLKPEVTCHSRYPSLAEEP